MPLPNKCEECGEPIGHAMTRYGQIPISRIQVLALSMGLSGPNPAPDYFDEPLAYGESGTAHLCVKDGQDMLVRHDLVCGRKAKRGSR